MLSGILPSFGEIAKPLGLEKKQIVNWVTRYNHEQARREAETLPKKKGRARKNAEPTSPEEIIKEQAYEIECLLEVSSKKFSYSIGYFV